MGQDRAGASPVVAFVMEQHLGHQTYGDNLRRALAARDDIVVHWVPVAYAPTARRWERLPSESLRGTLRGRAEVAAGLAARPADARVYNTQVPAVIGPRRARVAPYVLCTDVTPVQYDAMAEGYQHAADRPGPLKWLKHRWNERVFRGAAAHAPWSSWAAESLVVDYGVDRSSIHVIPPGIDTTAWQPASPDDGTVRLLFVGGDFRRKGGELLLRAFGRLPAGAAELHLVTRSTVERQPGVTVHDGFAPNDPGLVELYRRSDVFVLPSASETFGIAAIEGGAAGLPVVVASVGGLRDLVVDGTTGFAVPPDDVDALTAVLSRLTADVDLRRTMGVAARERAVAEFDATTNADRLVTVVLDCVHAMS